MKSHVAIVLLVAVSAFRAEAYGSKKGTGGCLFANFGKGTTTARRQTIGERRLLQSNCNFIQLDGETISLVGCSDLSLDLGTDFKFSWSVIETGNGNSTLRGAIDAAASTGSVDWAAVGFQPELEMIGANAFIVRACSSCASGASVDDYYLSSEAASGVKPQSQLSVISQSAALSSGRLQAIFEVSLSFAGSALKSVGLIYAAGPVDSTGALEQHTYYSGEQINLSTGLTSSLGPALTPSADTPGSFQGVSPVPAIAGPPANSHLATAPTPSGACSLQYAGNSSIISYAHCQSLSTASTATFGFLLLWNLYANPIGNGSILSGALESGNSRYRAGFGIPSTPGAMIGGNSIIAKPCSSCPSGASADVYQLASYDVNGIVGGTGDLKVKDLQAAVSSSGSIQATFTMFLEQSVSSLSSPLSIIAAVGPASSSGGLQSHPLSYAYAGTVDLASGAVTSQNTSSKTSRKALAHALLMIIGWGLLLPLGVVFARCKEWGLVWFQLHRLCQALGYLAGTAGAAAGLALGRVTATPLEDNHRIIGLTVFILLTVQVSAIFWRPAPLATTLRYTWNFLHWLLGGSAIFLAFANVFIGLKVAGQPGKWSGLYALGFALLFLLWLAKICHNGFVLKRTPKSSNGQATSRSLEKGSPESSLKLDTPKPYGAATNGTVLPL